MNVIAAVDGQCHYYLTRKRRYCRFQPKEGQQYCPEHACVMGIHGKRKRIPCPLNPKHNCYEDELDKHVKKCNVTKTHSATQGAAYYIQGINKSPGTSQTGELSLENKKVCVKDLTSKELAALIARVDKLYQDHVDIIETSVLEHPCVRGEYCGQEEDDLVKALGDQAALRKELLQQASLIGQLQQLGLLNGGHCFVEMGAGKGKLSHWIQKASKDVANSYLLIDRSSVRYKMDSFHKQGGAESEFKRIKVDIEDLCLGFVDLVKSSSSVVVVGKHLCGGATDMGVKCAVETLGAPETCQNSSSFKSNSSEELSADLNLKKHQCSDSQAKRESPALPDKPSNLHKIDETYTTTEDGSTVGTFDGSGVNVAGYGPEHPPQSDHNRTSSEQISEHVIETHIKQESSCDAIICRGYKVKDSKRKESDPTDLPSEKEPPTKTQKLNNSEYRHKLPRGIMIALCCHHRCTWDTYIGREFMSACGISPQEFDLLTRLSSWATCAKITAKSTRSKNNENSSGKHSEENDLVSPAHQSGIVGTDVKAEDHRTDDLVNLDASTPLREQLSVSEREDIGRKCKRLIDTGRLHYLRSKGMKCFLRQYIDEELTPENVVLLAHIPDS
ncbi:hypothetical protein BsWGS_20085 [Bradybaena similaris]